MPFITVTSLNKRYRVGAQDIHVLRDLELSVEPGEMVAVMGASGVGKSTLLHLLGGLDRPDSGTVVVDGRDLATLSDEALVGFRNAAGRLRLPVPSPAAGVFGAGKRRDADAHRAAAAGRGPIGGTRLARGSGPGRAGSIIGRRCCLAASSSAWRSRVRW